MPEPHKSVMAYHILQAGSFSAMQVQICCSEVPHVCDAIVQEVLSGHV
jgi:hypothetical protein